MEFNHKYSPEQQEWCEEYQKLTGFDPLMGDFESGFCSFYEDASGSVNWFISWYEETYTSLTNLEIPE